MRDKRPLKILYLMHVDWNWIKQRPHFLAEELAEEFDVLVLHALSRSRKNLVRNPSNLARIPIVLLPSLIPLISPILTLLHKIALIFIIAYFRPTTVWLTHPRFFSYIPGFLLINRKLVYDCMDDVISFPDKHDVSSETKVLEQSLLKHASHIFCSSNNLNAKLITRGADPDKITVVLNAFDGHILPVLPVVKSNRKKFTVCYIGTISEWIDFEALLFTLAETPDLEYHFVGPVYSKVPRHRNIVFHGVVSHEKLYEYVREYDSFILPFKLNELVESVDPVKFYEYINLNKHIISIRYDEIQRYEHFVHYYSSCEDLIELISRLRFQTFPKYSLEERSNFLANNTWSNRGSIVRKMIEG